MALKNTLRQPRRSLLLGGAIAFGVLVMSLASGFTAGMEKSLQDNVTLLSSGHVLINGTALSLSGRTQNRIRDPGLATAVQKILPGAVTIAATSQSQATIVYGTREQQLRIRGVDWQLDRLYSGNLVLIQGDWTTARSDRTIILGARSARRFGIGLGDTLLVRLSTVSGQQNVVEYTLGAVYDDDAAGGMNSGFVALGNLTADLNMPAGEYQTLAVFLGDASRAESVAGELKTGLEAGGFLAAGQAGYRISTIAELSGQVGAVLGSVRWIGVAIFAIMQALVAAGIANTYRMVLLERTKEIGMLRCIGFSRRDIFRIFLYEALLIALAATLAGLFASIPLGTLVHLLRFDPSGELGTVLSRGHLHFSPQPGSLLAAAAAVLAAAALAVAAPARKAARLPPAEAMRTAV
jgi:putative ABC transport system permease protein